MNAITRCALVLAALVALAGCGAAKQPVYDGNVAAHSIDDFSEAPRAQYANRIPVFPGAELDDAMGSESWGDTADSHSYGMTWWFKSKATREQIAAFYDAALPSATRSTEEDGAIQWTMAPEGGEPGEEIGVLLDDDGFRIHEETKRKKKKPTA